MKFHRIVVLIDADNTNLANLEKLIQYISTRGRIVVKRLIFFTFFFHPLPAIL